MAELAQIALGTLALLFAFLAGHGTARRSSSIRLLDKWPHACVQFDSDMSQQDALRFLEMARETVLAEPEKPQDSRAGHQSEQPLGDRDD